MASAKEVAMRRRLVELSPAQRAELLWVRDHDRAPDLRLRAAAILKVADGHTLTQVGKHLLNRPVSDDSIGRWITRYQQEGLAGLHIRTGRGRKPVFSPSVRRRTRSGRGAGPRRAQALPSALRPLTQPLESGKHQEGH